MRSTVTDDIRWLREWCVIGVVGASILWHGRDIMRGEWRNAQGYEFEWIARSLADGHGYSLGSSPWLGPYENPYEPTAWVEPIQTSVMAVAFASFGDGGRLLLVLLNGLWLATTCLLLLCVGRQLLAPWAGAIAAVTLAAFNPDPITWTFYLGNSALATALTALSALVLLQCLKLPSYWNCLALGAVAGTLVLTLSSTVLFVPFFAVVVGLAGRSRTTARRFAHAAVLTLVAAAIILPWTARNWIAFGEFVPVRTGLGQNMHYAIPALAQTIDPRVEAPGTWLAPPWTASSPEAAVARLQDAAEWRALTAHSIESVRSSSAEWTTLNEAQRDALMQRQVFDFIKAYPFLTARLSWHKLRALLWDNWPRLRPIVVLAFLGVLLNISDRKVWSLVALVVLYMPAYLLSAPLYYRYRQPIDPILIMLGSMALVGLFRLLLRVRRRSLIESVLRYTGTRGAADRRDPVLPPAGPLRNPVLPPAGPLRNPLP